MKNSHVLILLVTLVITGCKKENVGPVAEISAEIGTSFIVSTPAKIHFKEPGITIYLNQFSNYVYPAFNLPIVSAVGQFKNEAFVLKLTINCERPECYYQDFNLEGKYVLQMEKVTQSTIIEDREGTDVYRVDAAQFILKAAE